MFEKYFKFKKYNNIGIRGLTNQLTAFCVSNIFKNNDKNILLITNSVYEANILYSFISKIEKNTHLFIMDDFLTSEALAISPDLLSIRLNTLNSINKGKNIVITNLTGLLRYLPEKKLWNNSKIKINKNINLTKEEIIAKLINIGYKSTDLITQSGQFANRGFVLDIFPINEENPYRIEFWGDEIDSIRSFNVDNQRSIEKINEFLITPFSEFISEKNMDIPEEQKYLKLFNNKISNIFEYLDNPITIFKDYNQIYNSNLKLREEILNYDKSIDNSIKTDYMFSLEEINFKDSIYLLTIDNLISNKKLDYIYDLKAKSVDNFNSNINSINNYFEKCLLNKKTIIISLSDDKKIERFKTYINFIVNKTSLKNIKEKSINIIKEPIYEGFEIDNYIFLTEKELFNNNQVSMVKNRYKIGQKIKDINNLTVGDYIVHINHGIGKYNGLKTIKKGQVTKDYLELLYKDNDKLYIPVEKIDLISKYSSKEGYAPKINKLGSAEWQKTKIRIKNKVKDIAEKLIKISAERASTKGFAFNKDDDLQLEFESEFNYNLTKDQIIATDKIKKAMESSVAMDMLLCGDVGFGKTEVAFRAMFKAVLSGKQVAYLCPTTILSNQQYLSAKKRFSSFGIEIGLLNRFTPPKEVKCIIEKITTGKIDIVFGTHRLLSNDINFKNLGLLVVDEEQRFGVMHKEKIKEYKSNIDILTLSATPIPRTLQMSLVGIRDLAIIETPPLSRYPVQTYVIEENNEILKDAIYKELSRNGQIFIVYNNIEDIENKKFILNKLVPEAKIEIAHGRMTKVQIENVMQKFINNEFNILLCTTIIETGMDISNVNTLIIFDSDKFGLSQLYQLRGRVGRTNKIAYAYLLYEKNKVLKEISVKRLNTIKEFTELGSGFSIAMRDLSIRGAGDILGSEQAGFIDSVGYDLYVKILNDEVKKLKGEKIKEEIIEKEKPIINVSTHITKNYVNDDNIKIEIHKLISKIDSKEKLYEVNAELKDRFGQVSEEMIIYMYSKWLEVLANSLNINDITENNLFVEFSLSKSIVDKVDVQNLFVYSNNVTNKVRFNYKNNRLYIKILLSGLEKHFVYYLTDILDYINKKV